MNTCKYVVLGFLDDEETMPIQCNFSSFDDANEYASKIEGTLYYPVWIEGSIYAGDPVYEGIEVDTHEFFDKFNSR